MIKTRFGLFETNSSSTHAIVVPKRTDLDCEDFDLYTSWDSYDFEFGRETYRILEHWDYKLAYIYLVLCDYNNYNYNNYHVSIIYPTVDLDKFKERVIKIYNKLKTALDKKQSYDEICPEHIFTILDFINSKWNGKLKDDAELDIVYSDRFDNVIEDSYAGVDHTECFYVFEDNDRRLSKPCSDFLEKILTDDEYLEKFLFYQESYITIGGDEYRGYNLKTIGFEYDYNFRDDWIKRVDEYKKDFDVYFKGN